MKFLIVDDNKRFRKYLRDLIIKKDDECIELDDGSEVNSVYRKFKPDWVLLDIQMKNVNGFKAAEQLKKDFPGARFAIVSDYSDDRFRKKASKVGAAAFVSKENLYELYELVHSNLFIHPGRL